MNPITVLDLIRRGFVVAPAKDDTKFPGVKADAPGLTLDQAEARLRWPDTYLNRYNVIVGSKKAQFRCDVIDVETDGPEGEANLLEACGGNIPAGPRMITASGSVHRLFAVPDIPDGMRYAGHRRAILPKVDAPWQFLALYDGERTWHDFDLPAPELPAGLLALLLRPERKPVPKRDRPVSGDTPERERAYAVGALRGECRELAALVKGDDRNKGAYLAGLKMGGWVEAETLDNQEVLDAILGACHENGSVTDYGEDEMDRQTQNGIDDGRDGGPKYAPIIDAGGDDGHHPLTEAGNAQRLVDRYGDRIMYVSEARAWFVWDGCRWVHDTDGHVVTMAKTLPQMIHQEAEAYLADADKHKAWTSWARQSGMARVIKASLDLASSDPRVRRSAELLDADPWLLNTPTGVIDLRTAKKRDAEPGDYLTKMTVGNYRPGHTSEAFTRALEHATGADKAMSDYLQLAAGYTLSGLTIEEVFFYLYGGTRSGKGTFTDPFRTALGDYGIVAKISTFIGNMAAGHSSSSDVARMAGARMVLTAEPGQGQRLNIEFVKDLTGSGGSGKQTARFLFKDDFEFTPQLTLWFTANDRLQVDHRDEASYRRMIVVPFDNSLPKDQVDIGLKEQLTSDQDALDAILTWAVEGCRRWWEMTNGGHSAVLTTQMPPQVEQASEAYRAAMNPLSEFIEDYCAYDPDAWEAGSDLLDAVNRVMPMNRAMTAKTLGKHLSALPGVTPARETVGKKRRGWQGLRLLPTDAEGNVTGPADVAAGDWRFS